MHPDLSFEQISNVTYVMVSSHADTLGDVDVSSYILGNYAAVFSHAHAAHLPGFTDAALSIGQNASMVELLESLSGSGYVLRHAADKLIASGRFQLVRDAPSIGQPIFCGLHLRNRHRSYHRKLLGVLRAQYAGV